jgi:DNA repair exonuclease SbcCD nuclease subunit
MVQLVENKAREYELISIAGDLLDIFSKVATDDQLVLVTEFLRRLAQKTSVAGCSGNHDQVEVLTTLVAGAKPCYSAS